MRTPLLLTAMVALLATAAYAMPSMSWSVSVSTPHGTMTHEMNVSATVPVPRIHVHMDSHDFNIPIHFRHHYIHAIHVHGERMTVELNNGTELNILVPPVAAQHIVQHFRNHIQATIDENTLQNIVLQHMELNTCVKQTSQASAEFHPCYVAPVRVRARLLGILPVTTTETVQVDAETGEVSIKTPWWAFLLIGPRQLLP